MPTTWPKIGSSKFGLRCLRRVDFYDLGSNLARIPWRVTAFFKTIIALVFLPPLVAALFVYHAEMMISFVRFSPEEIPYLEFADTD